MATSLILAIDQGGQSTRVAVFDINGNDICCFSAPCATTHTFNAEYGVEFIEQVPLEILGGITCCLEKIADALGDNLQHIKYAGFAGQGSSLLCWDKLTGEALTPVLSWQDIRGEPYFKNLLLSHAQTQSITGLRLSPHYGASKIQWCLENYSLVNAALKNKTLQAGPIVSYIFWHLLNQKSNVDPGHAQRTLLWNLHNNNWERSFLDMFAIPESILPECKYHNSEFGLLELRNKNISFTASARDQGASLFARGLPDKTACYINIGTGAFIQRVTNKLQAPDGLLVSPLWIAEKNENLYAWEATVNGAASALPFIREQVGFEVTPEKINHALGIEPKNNYYFLNAIGGLSAPYWRTDLQSKFSDNLSPDEKIIVWIESVVFQIAVNVILMNELGKAKKIISQS